MLKSPTRNAKHFIEKIILSAALGLCLGTFCSESITNENESCLCSTPSSSFNTLQVLAPEGGETYLTGDILKIRLCYVDTSEMLGGEELHLELAPGNPGGGEVLKVFQKDEITSAELDLLKKGQFHWKIPKWIYWTIAGVKDSIEVKGDSCRIRFQGYEGSGAGDNFHYSGYFRIR